ncbi:Major facilitator superfamily domain general substrate transporter [Penicillium robsamsonii]|uniref:Major facilitator superfamily domain general substrate transporter n=1 Tax=Penicillium robsamsonii TaxID=1792511 RepID=UPI002547BBEA|nr:Major facilitator superfamily domain general substrate transporter [Penicillium robsamsonii]KAJ5827835.1 Major facilitator superfamily domain general substrate transporter [Penicillium robsamsonii]
MEKMDSQHQHIEGANASQVMESAKKCDFYVEDRVAHLSEEHRNYLLAKHGTLDLDPIPDMTDADPYNWPRWRKNLNLTLVAFHAMMGTFTASSIQSAFENISEDLDISMQRTSYLVSLFIAVLGGAPLFWRPLCNRYGRRPIFLISLICSLIGNIGCAKSPSYATMALSRAICAFFISPAAAIGSAVVAETFFRKDRARCMGAWTLMVTLGVPAAPFIFGFVALRVGYRWIYYILAIVNAIQFATYFLFGSESLYVRDNVPANNVTAAKQSLFKFSRIDPAPLRLWDFVQPLSYVMKPCVIIPAAAYAMVFLWGSIALTIEISQVYPSKFGLNTQQVGLQFLAIIIGSVIGEQIGGFISDRWMLMRQRRTGEPSPPEHRLWLSYIGHALTICGIVVFAIEIRDSGGVWNIAPIMGAAIAAGGNQIVTTVDITYAVDCYREDAASVGVFITFVRQTWGFIGPFWFPEMFEVVGWAGGAGIAVALMVGVSVIPTILVQWRGASWR